jgi:nifR3 family TIM-barrel protein
MPTAIAVVREVVNAVHIPVTVKLRAGWDHQSITAPELAEAFERVGVAAIAVHARTRDDQYLRPANWEFIRLVRERVSIPVIGNGDVKTPEDARRMLETTGADGVMVGRASFGDPWIFRRINEFLKTGEHLPPPDACERAVMARIHVRRMVEVKGEDVAIREMRKQLAWYLHGTPGSSAFRSRSFSMKTLEDAETLIGEWLDHARNEDLSWT